MKDNTLDHDVPVYYIECHFVEHETMPNPAIPSRPCQEAIQREDSTEPPIPIVDFLPGVDDFDIPIVSLDYQDHLSEVRVVGNTARRVHFEEDGKLRGPTYKDNDDDSLCTLSTKDSTTLPCCHVIDEIDESLDKDKTNDALYDVTNGDDEVLTCQAVASLSFESRDDSYFVEGFICVGDLPRVY